MSATMTAAREWIRVCTREELEQNEVVTLETDPPIAVFASEGEFFAVAETCTHEDGSLAEGFVEDAVVECPAHFARFCLRTGAVLGPPATRPLDTYPVRIEDGDVYVAARGGS
jgi:3-phenylpropionate/trans-cinnamate dioxygenase ferredoxin subunit